MSAEFILGDRHVYVGGGGWSRRVSFSDGSVYVVGVERGKMARIMYKPRGQNRGFHWWGFVRTHEGRRVWEDRVGKSLGARGLLRLAGLVPMPTRACDLCAGIGRNAFGEDCSACKGEGALTP